MRKIRKTDMQISEPMTMLTDYILAGQTVFFSIKLLRKGNAENESSVTFWGWAMLMLFLGALIGGTSHGFTLYFNETTKFLLKKATVFSIGLTIFFMLIASTLSTIKKPLSSWLLLIPGLQLIFYSFWMATHDNFIYVVWNYSPALFAIILMQIYAYRKFRSPAALWIISGMLISVFAAGVQVSGFALHKHFNHNDLYHVIQMGGLFIAYKGALLSRDC